MAVSTGAAFDRYNKPTFTEEEIKNLPEDVRDDIVSSFYNRKYGGGMSAAELEDFNTLVDRLEKSKLKQAGQANRARQRDVFAGGLASMMGNF